MHELYRYTLFCWQISQVSVWLSAISSIFNLFGRVVYSVAATSYAPSPLQLALAVGKLLV